MMPSGPFAGIEFSPPDQPIPLELPTAKQLMPVGAKLPPIRLEASYTQPISLRDALIYAVDNTLAIRIQQTNVESTKWIFGAALGGFLGNILMDYRSQIQSGSQLVGGVIPSSFHNPFIQTYVQFQQYVFQGGKVLFTSLQTMNNWKAAKAGLHATLNNTLQTITQDYYNLVQNQALLAIQVSAVETSQAQLDLNQKLERGGVGTHFNVLQSETQLATDQQNLLAQEVALRTAAIQLATDLNLNLGVNLLPLDGQVRKVRLVDPALEINDLLAIAVDNRPELKQYNYLRIAARRNIQIQAAPFYPTMFMFGQIQGSGDTLSKTYTVVPGKFQPVPLDAPAPAPVLPYSSLLPGGPTPAKPTAFTSAGEQYVPPTLEDRQIRKSTYFGFEVDWNFYNMGVPYFANTQAAKAQARQSMLNYNQQLILVMQQVRNAYLNSLIAERQIEVATKAVASSTEQLRLAIVRLSNGVGTNIDVLQATQAWVTARTNLVNAIIQFNISQANLVQAIGVVSVETLTSGRLVRK